MYPVLAEINPTKGHVIDTLRRVKDAQRGVPHNGWSYFASRFLHPDGAKAFQSSPATPEIIFDFLGFYQQLERSGGLFEQEAFFPESYDIGPDFHRLGLIEITAAIVQGCLRLKFEYNKNMKHQAYITRWVQKCEETLYEFIPVLTQASHMCILSDFPLLTADYNGLDGLVSSILPELGVSRDNVEEVYDTSPMQTGLLLSQAKDPSLYQCFTVFQVTPKPSSQSIDLWLSQSEMHSLLTN
jgi:fumiquinazoline F synthetase